MNFYIHNFLMMLFPTQVKTIKRISWKLCTMKCCDASQKNHNLLYLFFCSKKHFPFLIPFDSNLILIYFSSKDTITRVINRISMVGYVYVIFLGNKEIFPGECSIFIHYIITKPSHHVSR